jgi:hypothetical protein
MLSMDSDIKIKPNLFKGNFEQSFFGIMAFLDRNCHFLGATSH